MALFPVEDVELSEVSFSLEDEFPFELYTASTKGNGIDLVIGSNTYIDDFEEQLIGHHPGETVDVNVTFPENYGKDNLTGKDALFKVTINGIYQ